MNNMYIYVCMYISYIYIYIYIKRVYIYIHPHIHIFCIFLVEAKQKGCIDRYTSDQGIFLFCLDTPQIKGYS